MTIPSTKSTILTTEDWTKIYQSFPNAEFQSYDFDTLRRIMIQYLQENFPEDFNDYTDSSEFIALVDLIAYLGQNLSFRIDLNARENFLETASRRDSILRLAQLISYTPSRNIPASGLLKITAISTTDTVVDSTGINLANTTVIWNDATNSNWYEQFIDIINSVMSSNFSFGSPYDRQTINGILTEQYRINSTNTDVPTFRFSKTISGTPMGFEIVSSTISGGSSIEEVSPLPGNSFSFVYQNDNQGNSSPNTGFFTLFKQGQLGVSNFSVSAPTANEIIGVNISNINNTDVWLWQQDVNGNYTNLWTKVPAITGSSVIYNSVSSKVRNIYSVTTRDQDQIDLNFSDGSFGNLPQGSFSLFYRQSNGLVYTITPQQMGGIVVDISYNNQNGQPQTLTLTMGLQYTVSNSSGSESNQSIQTKAPQVYYTQNRMVTAEDYNIAPLTFGGNLLKVKSIARVTSGVSRYFELSDVSGKYSSTNIFASDGILYKNASEGNFSFTFKTKNDIWLIINNQLKNLIADVSLRSFYLDQYPRPNFSGLTLSWIKDSASAGQSTGHFITPNGPISVGSYISNNLKYVNQGALIKFVAPGSLSNKDIRYNSSKNYFNSNGKLVKTQGANGSSYIWATVSQVIGDGSNIGQGALSNGNGPISLTNIVDSNAIPVDIIPTFINALTYGYQSELVDICYSQKNFGLSFDVNTRTWNIIVDLNLDLKHPFSLAYQNDNSNTSKDSSWVVAFVWQGDSYKVRYRFIDYIFQSEQETAFYIDPNKVNYDFVNNTVIKDQINVLSINPLPTNINVGLGKDYQWQIDNNIIETDGYIDPTKVKISFYDYNNTGQIADPDSFNNIVQTTATNSLGYLYQFVYFQIQSDGQTYLPVSIDPYTFPTPVEATSAINRNLISPNDGDLFYFYNPSYNVLNTYSSTSETNWVYSSTASSYIAYPGTSNLKFQYLHNSGEDTRIDPSKTNIVDIYLLTADYDSSYRYWLTTGVDVKPLAPSSATLEQNYSGNLEPIKTISDQIIFQPVSYKVLFGSQAEPALQATFKAVQSASSVASASSLQSRILTAINQFFSLDNWDFGQSFYFSELAAYVMNLLTPDITNFVIVPSSNNFGSLYEITCLGNEIFISGATTANIEIISAITASQLGIANIVTNSGS
jgi:hypothetical protein